MPSEMLDEIGPEPTPAADEPSNARGATDAADAARAARPARARPRPPATPAEEVGPPRSTLRQRIVAATVIGAGRLACRLPERLLWRLSDVAGDVAYRAAPARRDQARRNLRRVVEWMDAHDAGGELHRRAAHDEAQLDRLVRLAFRHHVRYYVEMARGALFDAAYIRERLIVETPDEVAEALPERRAMILIAMHFGAIQMPAHYASILIGPLTAPMETIANPGLQRYILETRESVGMRLVPLEHAAAELKASLRRNEPVGLVGDRDLTGGGMSVEFFGAPAKLPLGPALLALESGSPIYVSGVRRAGPGRYRGNLRPLVDPGTGTRRERVRAIVEAEVELFERVISDAPEQWFTVFYPIWPDLEEQAAKDTSGGTG